MFSYAVFLFLFFLFLFLFYFYFYFFCVGNSVFSRFRSLLVLVGGRGSDSIMRSLGSVSLWRLGARIF